MGADRQIWRHDATLRAMVRENLVAHRRDAHPAQGLRRAAVAIVLAEENPGEAAFLLTRRPPRMSAHAGQYALPGGKVDPGETAEQAALRELAEELAIEAEPDQVLGVLDDLPTRSGYLVTPFVIWVDAGTPITPDAREIAALFHLPLGDLFAGRGRGDNRGLTDHEAAGENVFSLFIPSLDHDVFAPTAAILDHFREVALLGRRTPIVRFGEPNFARR